MIISMKLIHWVWILAQNTYIHFTVFFFFFFFFFFFGKGLKSLLPSLHSTASFIGILYLLKKIS